MDPRYLGANLIAYREVGDNGSSRPQSGFGEDAYYRRHTPSLGWATKLAPVAAVLAFMLVVPAAIAFPAMAGPFDVTEVDVQLVLAADVSGSMSRDELRVQREGYVAALRSRDVADALRSGALGRIALTYVEWAGVDEQAIVVPWTIVSSGHDLEDFSDRLAEGPRLVTDWASTSLRGRTSISDALLFAANLRDGSGVRSFGWIIDISGDGPNNEGPDIDLVRDAIVARGITINAIAITVSDRDMYGPYADMFGTAYARLRPYFEHSVIGGPGAFAMGVAGLDDFAETIQRKLVMEISAVRPSRTLGFSSLAHLGK